MAQKPKKMPKIGDMVVGDIDANRYSGYEVDVDVIAPVAVEAVRVEEDGSVVVDGIALTSKSNLLNAAGNNSVPIEGLVYGAEEHSWAWPDDAEKTAAAAAAAEQAKKDAAASAT